MVDLARMLNARMLIVQIVLRKIRALIKKKKGASLSSPPVILLDDCAVITNSSKNYSIYT